MSKKINQQVLTLRSILCKTLLFGVLGVLQTPLASRAIAEAKPPLATVTGEIEVMIADDFKNQKATKELFLAADDSDKKFKLVFKGATPNLETGTKVKVRGQLKGDQLSVDNLTEIK